MATAIMAAAGIEKADRAEDMACPNTQQNIMVLSTPSVERAEKYARIQAINVQGKIYEVSAYGTTAHDTVKGVIRGIGLEDSEAEIMQQIVTKYNPLAAGAKRIGNTTTVIVVFNGTKVPRYVRYGSTLYPCSLYRKQIEVCKVCGKVGHRRDVCPTPSVRVCLTCGVCNPKEGHKCVPKCKLCGGEHPTGDRFCRAKYKVPYVVRRRRWERRNAEERQKQALESSSFPRLGRSRSRSASRSGSRRASRSASRHASRHASRSASRSASRGRDSSDRVSWADAARGKVKSSSVSSNSATTSRSTPSSWQAWTTSPYYKELEQLRATNATLVKTTRRLAQELAEVKKELQAQQAQPITAPRQSNETPTPAVTNEQSTCTPSDQGTQSMDTAQDAPQEEKTTDPTPKKRARTSSQNHTELTELETKLEAKIEAIGNTYASTAAVTDQRLARLEELITTSFRNIQEQFGFIEQTLKPIVCSPIFAAQFGNHPYLQEQTQAPTPLQSCPSPKPE